MKDEAIQWMLSGLGGLLEILRKQIADRKQIPGDLLGQANKWYEQLGSLIDEMEKKKV